MPLTYLKSVIAHFLSSLSGFKTLIDLDKDGDIDHDDIKMLFEKVVDILEHAPATIAEWGTLTPGQRIDAVVAVLKEEFPNVRTMAWVILEGFAYLYLFIKNGLGAKVEPRK